MRNVYVQSYSVSTSHPHNMNKLSVNHPMLFSFFSILLVPQSIFTIPASIGTVHPHKTNEASMKSSHALTVSSILLSISQATSSRCSRPLIVVIYDHNIIGPPFAKPFD